MEKIKLISLFKAFKLSEKDNIVCYVLPQVDELKEGNKGKKYHYVLTFIHKKDVYLIEKGLSKLGNLNSFRAGMRLRIFKGENKTISKIYYKTSMSPVNWRLGGEVNKVRLNYGQSILVTAPPASGKSYLTRKISDDFLSRKPNGPQYRILFAERKDDDLGPGTIDCDSAAPLNYQIYVLYKHISLALRDAYSGEDVLVAIDSLTRMAEQLSNMYSHTHMVSGGISSSVVKMVTDLFRMAGQLGKGTLTIIGTCLWARSSGTWKNIYNSFAAAANAEFHPDVRSGKLDASRRETTVPSNYFTVLGIDMYC